MRNVIDKLTGPLQRRARLMVRSAKLLLVDDAAKLQKLQLGLFENEVRDAVRVQAYGLTSHPLPGAAAVACATGGDSGQLLAVAIDDPRYRPTGLQPGEVCVYTAEGDRIVMRNGHLVEIHTQTLKVYATTGVELQTPLLQVTGGDVKADSISLKTHKHGGVQTGSGQTGVAV